jgi:hypothetical protein
MREKLEYTWQEYLGKDTHGINLLGGKLSNWQNESSTMLEVSILHIFVDYRY